MFVLQGGSWVFNTADETWKKLMSGVSKWTVNKAKETNKPTFTNDLIELLAAKNQDFASLVLPNLSFKRKLVEKTEKLGEDVEESNDKDPLSIDF